MVICKISNILNIEKTFVDYYRDSFVHGVPLVVIISLISIFCTFSVTFLIWKGLRRGLFLMIRLLLFEYLIIIYCSTVITRNANGYFKYDFHPLWSYKAIVQGQTNLLAENLMNVLVFIPVGLLLGLGFQRWSFIKIIGFGILFSISVEFMQLVFKRGFCEIDDVIHNTLGCMIGYGMYLIVSMCIRKINNIIVF